MEKKRKGEMGKKNFRKIKLRGREWGRGLWRHKNYIEKSVSTGYLLF